MTAVVGISRLDHAPVTGLACLIDGKLNDSIAGFAPLKLAERITWSGAADEFREDVILR